MPHVCKNATLYEKSYTKCAIPLHFVTLFKIRSCVQLLTYSLATKYHRRQILRNLFPSSLFPFPNR